MFSNRTVRILLLFTTLAGAWLRFSYLDHYGLWFDEWITVEQSTRPSLAESLTASATHPPLQRLLVRASIGLFGDALTPGGYDFAVRIPSALFGTLGIPLIFLFARRFSGGDARVGLIAAAIYAIIPYGIYYGQEARYYAGMVFFAAWSLHGTALLSDAPRSFWRQLNLTAALLLGIYNHHLFGLLFLLTYCCVAPRMLGDLRQRWPLTLPWLTAGLCFLPWFFHVLSHLEPQSRPWVPDFSAQWDDTGLAFFTGRIGAFHLEAAQMGRAHFAPLSQMAWVLLATGFVVHVVRRWRDLGRASLCVVSVSLCFTAVAHYLSPNMRFFHHKYLAFLYPFVCLALAELPVILWQWRVPLREDRLAPVRVSAWTAILAITLTGLAVLLPPTAEAFRRYRPDASLAFHRERYRTAARWIQAHRHPTAVVVIFDPHRQRNNVELFRYYGLRKPLVAYRHHELTARASFWARHVHQLSRARELIVVTAHCLDEERQIVETTTSWGFPRRQRTLRWQAAEGLIQVTIFGRAPEP